MKEGHPFRRLSGSGENSIPKHWPVLGICGYSGAGKTSLIEAVLPPLCAKGLRVGVIKHDAHGLTVDAPGKDSDRFFRAGADVAAHGPQESFIRRHSDHAPDLRRSVADWLRDHDLVLVEGHKQTMLPARVWLRRQPRDRPPPDAGRFDFEMGWGIDRPSALLAFLEEWLPRQLASAPVKGGVLIGGTSSRMGRPKAILRMGGKTWLERIVAAMDACVEEVVVIGGGQIPSSLKNRLRIPDAPQRKGPIAGLLGAMRWDPWATWLFLPCDVPRITEDALRWLLAQRAPGVWGVMPLDTASARPQPLPAWYDFRLLGLSEEMDRPIALASHPKICVISIPPAFQNAFCGINTPKELLCLRQSKKRPAARTL